MKDKDRIHHLGELQHAIMRVLWAEGQASVSRVYEALPREHRRALTTIATMLTKMERKGVVTHRSEGRQFIYEPAVAETDVRRTMVEDLTERLFDGDVAALVSHLLTEQEIEREELVRLQQLIEARRKGDKGHGRQ